MGCFSPGGQSIRWRIAFKPRHVVCFSPGGQCIRTAVVFVRLELAPTPADPSRPPCRNAALRVVEKSRPPRASRPLQGMVAAVRASDRAQRPRRSARPMRPWAPPLVEIRPPRHVTPSAAGRTRPAGKSRAAIARPPGFPAHAEAPPSGCSCLCVPTSTCKRGSQCGLVTRACDHILQHNSLLSQLVRVRMNGARANCYKRRITSGAHQVSTTYLTLYDSARGMNNSFSLRFSNSTTCRLKRIFS